MEVSGAEVKEALDLAFEIPTGCDVVARLDLTSRASMREGFIFIIAATRAAGYRGPFSCGFMGLTMRMVGVDPYGRGATTAPVTPTLGLVRKARRQEGSEGLIEGGRITSFIIGTVPRGVFTKHASTAITVAENGGGACLVAGGGPPVRLGGVSRKGPLLVPAMVSIALEGAKGGVPEIVPVRGRY